MRRSSYVFLPRAYRFYNPASSGFSRAWLLAFTESFAWLSCRLVSLFTPREKSTMRQTSHANDSVNAKSHEREKPLLAEYVLTDAGW